MPEVRTENELKKYYVKKLFQEKHINIYEEGIS